MFALEIAYSEPAEARLAARPPHREKMAALAESGRVLASGPYADGSGALLVFLVDTREEMQELLDADPYYATEGVEVVSLREWSPVVLHPDLPDL